MSEGDSFEDLQSMVHRLCDYNGVARIQLTPPVDELVMAELINQGEPIECAMGTRQEIAVWIIAKHAEWLAHTPNVTPLFVIS